MVSGILFVTDRPTNLNPFLPLIFESLKEQNYDVFEVRIKNKKNFLLKMFQLRKKNIKFLFFTRTQVLPFILIIMFLSKLARKETKFIYWPFELYGHQTSKYSSTIKRLETLFINQFNLLITQNNFRLLYYRIIGRKQKIIVVRNYKPIHVLNKIVNNSVKLSPSRRLVYIGSLIKGRNLENFISTVLNMDDIQLVVYAKKKASGNFIDEHRDLILKGTSLNKLLIHDEVAEHLIPRILLDYEVGIIPYENNCLNNFTAAPAKLTEYLSAGLVCIVPDFPIFNELSDGNKFQFVKYHQETKDFRKAIELAFNQVNSDTRNLARKSSLELDYMLEVKKFIDSLNELRN